ncbi:MAG: CBS domain-containing protein [Chthonomonas sp.]|nr:CBS domain-containing protein [Chthonomonas sp.]
MTIREVLHAHLPVLSRTSTIRDTVDKMDIYQFPALVFVDDENRPLAVMTEGDLARAIHAQGNLSGLAHEPAIKYATLNPVTEHVDAEISNALHKMLVSGLTILPIVEDEYFMGVVLRVDLMQALLMDRSEDLPGT